MVEMTGNFIFNYLHEDDKKVFADTLGFELLPPIESNNKSSN